MVITVIHETRDDGSLARPRISKKNALVPIHDLEGRDALFERGLLCLTFNDGGLHVIASKDGIRKKGFIPRRGDPFGEDDSHWAKRGERRGES